MMKYICIPMLLAAISIFYSCGKDDVEVIDEEWKSANEKVISDLTFNSEYSRIMSPSNMGHIYYKVLKKGTGSEIIYYTDTVKVYYTGSLINDSIFDSAEAPYKSPAVLSVSGLTDGFKTALQKMTIGDRWEIWVPSILGYGASGSKRDNTSVIYTIPPYSTLKFEVEVVGLKRKGFWI